MTTITINNLEKKKSKYLVWKEFENLLQSFISDYIETKEDMELKKELKNDSNFQKLNKKLEKKLWN